MGKISLKEMNDHKAEKEESIEKIETVQKRFNHDGGFRNDDTSEDDMGKKEFVEFINKLLLFYLRKPTVLGRWEEHCKFATNQPWFLMYFCMVADDTSPILQAK